MPNIAIITTAAPTVPPLTSTVDGWPEEQHAIKINIAGAPVESGVETTDHSVLSSEQVTLTGWVSGWTGGRNPADAWGEVRRLARTREPIRLVTEWGVYPEMLIQEADAPKTHRGMRFTLKLVWINRVGITDSELPASATNSPAVAAQATEAQNVAVTTVNTASPTTVAAVTFAAQVETVAEDVTLPIEQRAGLLDRVRDTRDASRMVLGLASTVRGTLSDIGGLAGGLPGLRNAAMLLNRANRSMSQSLAGANRTASTADQALRQSDNLVRLVDRTQSVVTSARTSAAATNRSGEVERGRVALPPVAPVFV